MYMNKFKRRQRERKRIGKGKRARQKIIESVYERERKETRGANKSI